VNVTYKRCFYTVFVLFLGTSFFERIFEMLVLLMMDIVVVF
jgi:hypothetical protein